MEIVFDTNAISDFLDGDLKLKQALQPYQAWVLSVVVIGEYRFGIQSTRDRAKREEWLRKKEETLRVLTINCETTRYYSKIRNQLKRMGHPIPENDIWIAASCLENGLPILSRDKHFEHVDGLSVVAW